MVAAPAAFLGASVVAAARHGVSRTLWMTRAAGALFGATVVAGRARAAGPGDPVEARRCLTRGRRRSGCCRSGGRADLVAEPAPVSRSSLVARITTRGGESNDGDHRDGEQRAQLPVVGAENDCGVLCGVCLAHYCLLCRVGRLGGLSSGVCVERHRGRSWGRSVAFRPQRGAGAATVDWRAGLGLLYRGLKARVPTGMDFRILGPLEVLHEGRRHCAGREPATGAVGVAAGARQRDAQPGPADR